MITDEEYQQALVDLDRELIKRKGLREFVRLAWPQVEPQPFVDSWHIGAVCEHLQALYDGQILDLVICQPPGTSKSLLCSTLGPAYDWIKVPTRRYITASYGQGLAEKNAKLHRDLVASDWYHRRWPSVEIGKSDLTQVRLFSNTSKGWRFTTSVNGEMTGRHADVLQGDDLAKAQDATGRHAVDPEALRLANELWFGTLHTRRANPTQTRRLLIGQRLHEADTPGKAIDAGYCALVLPMEYDPRRSKVTSIGWRDPRTEEGELLLPERFPRSVVESDRATMPNPRDFEAQMNQNPTAITGALFRGPDDGPIDARRWIEIPEKALHILTCDATFKDTKKSDFVSIQHWASKNPSFYLIDDDTERRSFSGTVQALIGHRARLAAQGLGNVAIYIEDKANGPAIIDTLKGELTGIVPWDPKGASKISRAEAKAHLFKAGNVYLPPDALAPWIAKYVDELHKFPRGKNDDRVDATTMALIILDNSVITSYADAIAKLKGNR